MTKEIVGNLMKTTVKVSYHGKFYFVNKARLNYTLNKMGMQAKFDFTNEDMKNFLSKNKLLYTEFLEFISDCVRDEGEI